jgi:hypothetical protein
LEQELAEQRARRDGAELEKAEALERAAVAVNASRQVAGKFAAVVKKEAERASGAEERLRERVRKVCGVDLSSITEEEEVEEEEEEGEEGKEEESSSSSSDEEEENNETAAEREARLPPISFTV